MSPSVFTVRGLLHKLQTYLADQGVDGPALSAQLLLAKALGMDRVGLFSNSDKPLSSEETVRASALVLRRGRGEPVAHILGQKEFYGQTFKVTPDVLIPRPETEHLIEEAVKLFPKDAPLRFADFGTGSGCLAITLAKAFPNALGVALDISSAALDVAGENAARHGLADRVLFARGDFACPPIADQSLDLILANPPYVSEKEYAGLSPEVARFEPRAALVPGETGLEAVSAICPAVAKALKPEGVLVLEIGSSQGARAKEILLSGEGRFSGVEVKKDLAGLDRVVVARAR